MADFEKEKEVEKEKIKQALIKKATGFSLDEIIEEYSIDEDGNSKLSKRKITKKYVPADNASIKLLLDNFYEPTNDDLEMLTEEQLLEERKRLLLSLEEENNET